MRLRKNILHDLVIYFCYGRSVYVFWFMFDWGGGERGAGENKRESKSKKSRMRYKKKELYDVMAGRKESKLTEKGHDV